MMANQDNTQRIKLNFTAEPIAEYFAAVKSLRDNDIAFTRMNSLIFVTAEDFSTRFPNLVQFIS